VRETEDERGEQEEQKRKTTKIRKTERVTLMSSFFFPHIFEFICWKIDWIQPISLNFHSNEDRLRMGLGKHVIALPFLCCFFARFLVSNFLVLVFQNSNELLSCGNNNNVGKIEDSLNFMVSFPRIQYPLLQRTARNSQYRRIN
jgi:hypothetical protein